MRKMRRGNGKKYAPTQNEVFSKVSHCGRHSEEDEILKLHQIGLSGNCPSHIKRHFPFCLFSSQLILPFCDAQC